MFNDKQLEGPAPEPQTLAFLPTFMEQVLDTVERVLRESNSQPASRRVA